MSGHARACLANKRHEIIIPTARAYRAMVDRRDGSCIVAGVDNSSAGPGLGVVDQHPHDRGQLSPVRGVIGFARAPCNGVTFAAVLVHDRESPGLSRGVGNRGDGRTGEVLRHGGAYVRADGRRPKGEVGPEPGVQDDGVGLVGRERVIHSAEIAPTALNGHRHETELPDERLQFV